MNQIQRFRIWAEKHRKKEGIICHFYYSDKQTIMGRTKKPRQKQYYTRVDYAYFNLFCDSQEWFVKGTPEHGISGLSSQGYERSQVPCLNCYEINGKFYKALEAPEEEWNKEYEIGLILSKEGIRARFGEDRVKDVKLWREEDKKPRPPPKLSWCYDIGRKRAGTLSPFNRCGIVRIRIQKCRSLGIAIESIPIETIRGLLVKRGKCHAVRRFLQGKGWNELEIFPLL